MALERLVIFDKKFNVFMDVSGSDTPHLVAQKSDHSKATIPLLKSAKSSVFTVIPSAKGAPSDSLQNTLSDKLQNISISPTASADTCDPRLIIGACYSMRSTLQRLMPDRAVVDCFSWDTDQWRLLYHQSATGWKFVAIVRGFGGGKANNMDHRHLVAFYEQIFVPAVINSPVYYRQINNKERIVVSEGLATSVRRFFSP